MKPPVFLPLMCALAVPALLLAIAASARADAAGDPRQQFETFCASHAADCAALRQVHESTRQVCDNDQSTVGQCRQARANERTVLEALQAEGLPAPPHPPGPAGGDAAGEPPPP